jgi:drug/metabolite transporter (DMT)-like permease
MLQLSLVIPVSASILFWRETPSPRVCAGLALVVVAIVLLGIDIGRRAK